MSFFSRFLWIGIVCVWSCSGADVVPDNSKPVDTIPAGSTVNSERAAKAKLARQYVLALSSDSHMERAEAKNKLMALGRPAIEPLEDGARAEDSETRLRSLEILVALRGRGFLGIGLQEDDVAVVGEEDNNNNVRDAEAKLGSVHANQLIDFRQPEYAQLGVKRPFPAEAAKMEAGDRVVEVNGRRIHGIKDLMSEVILTGPGRVANLLIERGQTTLRVNALLTRNPTPIVGNVMGNYTSQQEKKSVDLEAEIDFSEEDKRVLEKNKNDEKAEAGDQNPNGVVAPRRIVIRR